jgi:HEAT repeat protein
MKDFESLEAPDLTTRRHAVERLRGLHERNTETTVALARRLVLEPDGELRNTIRRALQEPASDPVTLVETWIPFLEHQDHIVRARAAFFVGHLGPDAAPAVPALVANVGDPAIFSDTRWAAAFALARIGEAALPYADELCRVVAADHDPELRAQLVPALATLLDAGAVEPTLRAALATDADPHVREEAIEALAAASSVDSATMEALERAAREDRSTRVRIAAASACERLGRRIPAAGPGYPDSEVEREVARLTAGLGDESPWQRGAVSWKLGILGHEATGAVPALLAQLAGDDDPDARFGAAWALGRIGGDGVREALSHAVASDSDPMVRAKAAEALGALAGADGSPPTALVTALADEDAAVREEATRALGAQFRSVDTALRERVLADPVPSVRRAAVVALGGTV